MPKRSNKFQQLVLLLQKQIADAGSTVSESKMLKDRMSDDVVEVDVAVELTANGLPLSIGFEVRDTRRKIDRNGAIAIVGKYQNLVDRTVIVSRTGFTRSALKHCKMHGVDAITFTNAIATDWGEFFENFKKLFFVTFDLTMLGGPTIGYTYLGDPFRPLTEQPVPVAVDPNGQRASLAEVCTALVRDRRMFDLIQKNWYERPEAERPTKYEVGVSVAIPTLELEQEQFRYRIDRLDFRVAVNAYGVSLPMSAMQFADRRVMQGMTKLPEGKEVHLLVSEGPSGDRRAAVIFPGSSQLAPVVRTLELNLDPAATAY